MEKPTKLKGQTCAATTIQHSLSGNHPRLTSPSFGSHSAILILIYSSYYCANQGSGPSNAEQFQEHDQGSYPDSNSPTDATNGGSQVPSPEQYDDEYYDEEYPPPVEDPNNPSGPGLPVSTSAYESPSYASDYGQAASNHSYSPPVQSPYGAEVHDRNSDPQFPTESPPWRPGDRTDEENRRQQIAASHPEYPDLIQHPRDRDWRNDKVPKDLTDMEKKEQKSGKKIRNTKRKNRSPPMDKERYKKDRDHRGDGGHGFGRSTRV